jgi:flagellar M-ring protein FliF
MDFLNKALAQLNDLFRSMTPGARITAGLLLAVVVISLAYLFNHQISGSDSYLLGGQSFSAAELPAMEAAFGKANLSGYEVVGSRIRVPRGQQAVYMAALTSADALPKNFHDTLTSAVSGMGPFTSTAQQQELIKNAKQKELALIIRNMQGIENAAVHYDTQKKTGLRSGAVTTASVSVKPLGGRALDDNLVPMIRHLVSGAIAGLTPENVTVVDLNGRTYSGANGGGSVFDDPYLARVKANKDLYEASIQNALAYVPGVSVTVNVELEKELRRTQDKYTYDPKGSVPRRLVEETSNNASKSPASGGRPGLETQGPNTPVRLSSAGGPESTEERTSTTTENVNSHDHTQIDTAGLTPKRVTAAVGIPSNYYEKIWRERNPTAAGETPKTPDQAALEQIQREETEKIRAHVLSIIPQPIGVTESAAQLVTVTTFAHVAAAEVPTLAMTDQALSWLSSSWSTLGMIGLVFFSLLTLRSMVRTAGAAAAEQPAASPIAAAVEAAEPEEEEASAEAKPKRLKRRLAGTGPTLRDELADIVREDPDAAANILRGWIGNAS